jgi:tRNA nucleotidyltransferase (CCA-adding enzyme)
MASDSDVLPSASVPTIVLPEGGTAPTSNNSNSNNVVIRLDAAEESLFETLLKAADAFEEGTIALPNQHPHHINIRVAGGWVRDKLLQKHTHDVDIAIDTVSGVDFATLVQLYLRKFNPDQHVHRMGVIAANPSQSKHLETATMIVADMEVDFCNLRAQEIYASHSRIPTTRFGSPLEDAQRRDFTINALFFNLRTHQVEDWTKRGLRDLANMILVTPLDPNTTFHDDPLRVLRAIRFAVRYDMKFHPQLEEACKDPEVHETLHVKISRERVGKELEACLSGRSAKPQQALECISSLGLADSVFCLPSHVPITGSILGHAWMDRDATQLETIGWQTSGRIITLLPPILQAFLEHQQDTIATQVDLRLVHLGTFTSPFRHLHYKEKSKTVNVVTYMMRESIKFKNKDTNGMTTIMETVERMNELLSYPPVTRLDAGLLLRKCKDLWVTCLLVATCLKSLQVGELQIQPLLELYRTIVEMGLDECWNMSPLMNGQELIECLNLQRGPMVQQYLEDEVKWMLANPNGTRHECEQFLHLVKLEAERHALECSPHISKKMIVELENGGRTSFNDPK